VRTLDNVDRIPAPSAERLLEDYVLQRRPIIMTDLFHDMPIHDIDTADTARERIPGLPVVVQPNYMTSLLRSGSTGATRRTTLGRFLDQIEADPQTDDYCIEYDTPAEMNAYIRPTDHCRLIDPDDVRPLMFVAAPGNFAHLHYDGDQRHVLMYQVFGRKRYTIIDAREGRKVAPLSDPTMQRTSSIFLQNFSEDDKLAFLEYANAWDCVLEPGETLLMPMMAWHYVEYLDASMSVSYRLGRNRFTRFLAESVPIPSPYLQRLAIEFIDERAVTPRHEAALALLQDVSRRPHGSGEERARALDACCMQLCAELDPQWFTDYTFYDKQRREALTLPREPEAAPEGTTVPPTAAPAWDADDLVSLTPETMVLVPLGGAGDRPSVILARHGRLELRLTLDEARPWLLDLLRAVANGATFRVADLAQACGTDVAEIRGALAQLHERGWLAVPQDSDSARV
jgi:lysine-specific demethylase 8